MLNVHDGQLRQEGTVMVIGATLTPAVCRPSPTGPRDHTHPHTDPRRWGRPTVAHAMVTSPKICDPATTVEQARTLFTDDHVHALLVVGNGVLRAVVQREDLTEQSPASPVVAAGRVEGRIVSPGNDLATTHAWMLTHHRRRLVVVDPRRRLLGLLCLKKSHRGFCSDVDVASRAGDPTIRRD
ncbi:MAG TPA: CBS domain-containing protein [Pseudonocardia sp.]